MRKLALLSVGLSALVISTVPNAAKAYDAMFSFGDSLSDVGNVFLATGGVIPGSPYFNGRFSNGPIWLDQLSTKLNLGPVVPAIAGGNNYAFGGAVTGPAVPNGNNLVPNLIQQAGLFSAAHGGVAPSGSLYTIWIGGNDVTTGVADVVGGADPGAIAGAIVAAAQTEVAVVQALSSQGAHDFLIPLIPDLGQIPDITSFPPQAPLATAYSIIYDQVLVAGLTQLASSQNVNIQILDTFGLLNAEIANPALFGFTDVTTPCLGAGGSVCANPDQHLFWDGVHPTSAAQSIIAQAAFTQLAPAVPEPSTWFMALLGFAGLGIMARRSRKSALPAA